MLTPMRFRGFIWPHNPRTYTVTCERETARLKFPLGGYAVQDLGKTARVMRGEGEFFGPDAYAQFRALAEEFAKGGAGQLVHPVWQTESACFTRLELAQEPRADYVAYRFEFCEGGAAATGLTRLSQAPTADAPVGGSTGAAGAAQQQTARYHTVVRGDTLWGIGRKYGKTVAELVALNPQIANPNLIYAGQEVRIA